QLWSEAPRNPVSAFLLVGTAAERSQVLHATGNHGAAFALAYRVRRLPPVESGWDSEQALFSVAHGYLWFAELFMSSKDHDAAAGAVAYARSAVAALETNTELVPASRATVYALRAVLQERDGDDHGAVVSR